VICAEHPTDHSFIRVKTRRASDCIIVLHDVVLFRYEVFFAVDLAEILYRYVVLCQPIILHADHPERADIRWHGDSSLILQPVKRGHHVECLPIHFQRFFPHQVNHCHCCHNVGVCFCYHRNDLCSGVEHEEETENGADGAATRGFEARTLSEVDVERLAERIKFFEQTHGILFYLFVKN